MDELYTSEARASTDIITAILTTKNGENITGTPTFVPSENSTARALQISFAIILCVIMFAIGCVGDFAMIYAHLRHPAGIGTGIFNQFILMPLLAIAFVYVTFMPQEEALAVLIQGSAPGGMISNIITYWINGDVNLSIAMTTVSTLIALGTMPLWLFIFTSLRQVEEEMKIPFQALGIALATMIVPVVVGVIVKRYRPKAAVIVSKVLTVGGTLAIVITLIVSGIISDFKWSLSWRQWLVAFLTPLCGIVLGYATAFLPVLKLDHKKRKTIAIETGIQNCQISQSIVVISYAAKAEIFEQIRLYPLLNSFTQVFYGLVIVFAVSQAYRLTPCKKTKDRNRESNDNNQEANRDDDGSGKNFDLS